MSVTLPSLQPRMAEPLIDPSGFSIELWQERHLSPGEASAYEGPSVLLAHPTLTREPIRIKGLVSVDEDALWVSVHATGAGPFDAEAERFTRAWFRDLWEAVHAAARPGAEHLASESQLLALARACRGMSWNDAVVWAGQTVPGPACPP